MRWTRVCSQCECIFVFLFFRECSPFWRLPVWAPDPATDALLVKGWLAGLGCGNFLNCLFTENGVTRVFLKLLKQAMVEIFLLGKKRN